MFYPSITSTKHNHLETIKEAKKYGVKEICLFVTCLPLDERKSIYPLLEEAEIESIPLVHLRDDMELWELEYLSKRFLTQAFNCHSAKTFPLKNDLTPFNQRIFIENTGEPLDEEEIKKYAGICLDFSHLETTYFFMKDRYENDLKLLEKYTIGCGHVSAFSQTRFEENIKNKESPALSFHLLKDLSDIDYLEKYQKFFPKVMALELENSLEEQLKIIAYFSSKTSAWKV